MSIPLQVLIIEDNEDDVLLTVRELRKGGYDLNYERVETAEALTAALNRQRWDVILSDYSMPAFSAPEALQIVLAADEDLPFLIISGTVGEDTAVAAMKAGASDFFTKDKLTRLLPAIERAMDEAEERRKRKWAEKRLRESEAELLSLYNATSYLFYADSLLSLGRQIVEGIVREFKQIDCGLMLINPEDDKILRLARAGEYQAHPEIILRLDAPGLVATAVRTGQIAYAADVREHPHYIVGEARTLSELAIPLSTNKGVIAVLDLQSPRPNAFDESAQRVLIAFGERAAAALEIMQLYEKINQHAAELEWRVAQRTAELQKAKEQVEKILTSSSDAIVMIDQRGLILQTNPAFDQQFQYAPDALFRKPITIVIHADSVSRLTAACENVLITRLAARVDVTCVRSKANADTVASTFEAEFALSPIITNQTEAVHIICNIHDITRRVQEEESLRVALAKEKELSEMKTQFVSTVSHEFRTPLTIIQSSSEILESYYERLEASRRVELFENIRSQIQRSVTMLEEVLMFSRAQTVGLRFVPEIVDLEAFCRSLIIEFQPLTQDHRLVLEVEKAENSSAHFVLDIKLMHHAIGNLVSNAIKYSPHGSTIAIGLICKPDHVKIQIIDEGIGIPNEDLKHLFQPFHRARNVGEISGTGLGLAIVNQAVEAHHGSITVESSLGAGSIFTITLPRH